MMDSYEITEPGHMVFASVPTFNITNSLIGYPSSKNMHIILQHWFSVLAIPFNR